MQNKVKYQDFPKKRHGKNWLWDDGRIGGGKGIVESTRADTRRGSSSCSQSPWAHFRDRIHRGRKEGETPRSDPQKHLSQSKTFGKRPWSFSYAPRRQKTKREICPCCFFVGGNGRTGVPACIARRVVASGETTPSPLRSIFVAVQNGTPEYFHIVRLSLARPAIAYQWDWDK